MGGPSPPPPPKEKEKKKKERKKEREKRKKKERKKGTIWVTTYKVRFFQFFNSPVALKKYKKMPIPKEKVEITPLRVWIMLLLYFMDVHDIFK